MVIFIVSFVFFLYRTPYVQFVTSDMKTYRMDEGGLESYFRPSLVINNNILWIWGLLLFQVCFVFKFSVGLGVYVNDQCKPKDTPKKRVWYRQEKIIFWTSSSIYCFLESPYLK